MNDQTPDTLPPSGDERGFDNNVERAAHEGRTLGPYLLRERIGIGGMGEVWKAEQSSPIRRTVAIKLIKAGMDSREVLARFNAERQALALMDHPCIARVFDAGSTPQGRPYFAMEFVHGAPITEYCDKRRLSTRARLELFQQVCQGVQHAHQKSVLHRDLKPSNILVADVDGRAQPKIIDFGVAKATTRSLTENTMYTSIGQIIGTPEYMSPEQAEMTREDVDTRTDVYSLGVILYELLVGALPFEMKELRHAGIEGILKILREQDPPKPSTRLSSLGERVTQITQSRRTESKRLASQLRGDLDWIVMRALDKDRNRRYGSPSELAQDVQRHLDNEAVLAGPPTAGYRASKFVRRHRTGVTIASITVVALAAFASISVVQATAIARERDRAAAESAKAAAMNDFLSEMLASADPWKGGDHDVTVAQALDAAVEKIDTAFAGQPDIEASMRLVLGNTYLGLGKLAPATAQIERAARLRLDLDGPDGYELGKIRLIDAKLRQESAEYDAAVASAADAARIFELVPRAAPDDLVNAYQLQARNLYFARRIAEAESVVAVSEAILPRLEGLHRVLVAENYSLRSELLAQRGGSAAAVDSLSRLAYEFARSVDPENPVLPTYLGNAAVLRRGRGDYEGALEDLDLVLSLIENRWGTENPHYATILENRGGVYFQMGRVDETLVALEQVRDIRARNLGPNHIDVVRTNLNVGAVASLAGDYERALSIFSELEPVLVAARGRDHPDVIAVLRNTGSALRSLKRSDEALSSFEAALEICQRIYGDAHVETARSRVSSGLALMDLKRYAESERALLSAFDVFMSELGGDHVLTKDAAGLLIQFYEKTDRPAEAERYRPGVGE